MMIAYLHITVLLSLKFNWYHSWHYISRWNWAEYIAIKNTSLTFYLFVTVLKQDAVDGTIICAAIGRHFGCNKHCNPSCLYALKSGWRMQKMYQYVAQSFSGLQPHTVDSLTWTNSKTSSNSRVYGGAFWCCRLHLCLVFHSWCPFEIFLCRFLKKV